MPGTDVMLAHKWEESVDPTNWWMSEKLDGVRAFWTGSEFYSRQGNKFMAPEYFKKALPKTPLDGELWCGRGLFHQTMSIIKKTKTTKESDDRWKFVTYLVFDAPSLAEPYEKRVQWLQANIDVSKKEVYAAVVGISKCNGKKHLKQTLKNILIKGGEGIMLRKPKSRYEHKRSHTLLKVKFFHDEECRVNGHLPGTGRLAKLMGKLQCELPNGVKFKVGSGFTDAQRKNPPAVGSIITFKYQELSVHGNPRFPTFMREMPHLTWKDVVENAKTKVPFSQVKMKKAELKKQHSVLFSSIPSRDPDGNKVLNSDDEDDLSFQTSSPKKLQCKYGSDCYRSSKEHLEKFSHPSKPKHKRSRDARANDEVDNMDSKKAKVGGPKTACMFGAACYRTGAQHLLDYYHPPSQGSVRSSEPDDEEKEVQAKGESEDESGQEVAWGIHQQGSFGDIEQDEVAKSIPFVIDQLDCSKDAGVDQEDVVKIKKADWEVIKGVAKKLVSEGRLEQLLGNDADEDVEALHP